MKGYEAQKIPFYSQGSPKRTGDSYRIDRIAFRGFHALYFFQVDPTGTPELIYRLSHIKFHSVIGRRRITIQPPPSGLVKLNM